MLEGPLRTKSKLTNPSNWYWVQCIHIRQMATLSCMAVAIQAVKCEYFEGGTQVWCPCMENSLNAKKRAKFKLVKTTFNAESFIRRQSQSISSDFGTIRYGNVCCSQKSI